MPRTRSCQLPGVAFVSTSRRHALGAAEILIVEDDEVIMGTLAYNLSRQGYRVSRATTGAEALRIARRLRPDLILLDIMLPGESVIEVCERIREHDQEVVIVMITAKDAEEDKVPELERWCCCGFVVSETHIRVASLRVSSPFLGRGSMV